eukprot:3184774-Rhodomonas_salina.2
MWFAARAVTIAPAFQTRTSPRKLNWSKHAIRQNRPWEESSKASDPVADLLVSAADVCLAFAFGLAPARVVPDILP